MFDGFGLLTFDPHPASVPHLFGTVSGMEDVRVDSEGNLRCWKCGGKNFREKRTGRSKVVGTVSALTVVGVVVGAAGVLATKKKLYCIQCGEYNQVGNAKPFEGQSGGKPSPQVADTSGQVYSQAQGTNRSAAVAALQALIDRRKFSEYTHSDGKVTVTASEISVTRKASFVNKLAGVTSGTRVIPATYLLGINENRPTVQKGKPAVLFLQIHGSPVAEPDFKKVAPSDNLLIFMPQHFDEFDELVSLLGAISTVNHSINDTGSGSQQLSAQVEPLHEIGATETSNIGSELEKLASLRALGVLSEDEFTKAKSRLLGQ